MSDQKENLNGDKPQKDPSGWSLWFHPRRYAALWRERSEEIDMLRKVLSKSENEREKLKASKSGSDELLKEKIRIRDEENASLRKRIHELEEALNENDINKEELLKIEKEIERFILQKQAYEAEIKELKMCLKDASLRLKETVKVENQSLEEEELTDPCELNAGNENDYIPPHHRKVNMQKDPRASQRHIDETDWLKPLP